MLPLVSNSRGAAIECVEKTFRMSSCQMKFMQDAMRFSCQATLDLVLRTLSGLTRLEIIIAQPRLHRGTIEEHDYGGSKEILNSLAKLPKITTLCFDFDQWMGVCGKDHWVRLNDHEMLDTCFEDTFRNTNIISLIVRASTYGDFPYVVAIEHLGKIQTIDIFVEEGEDEAQVAMQILSEVHHSAPLRTLKIKGYEEVHRIESYNATCSADFLE